jgi:hypothetical protein
VTAAGGGGGSPRWQPAAEMTTHLGDDDWKAFCSVVGRDGRTGAVRGFGRAGPGVSARQGGGRRGGARPHHRQMTQGMTKRAAGRRG